MLLLSNERIHSIKLKSNSQFNTQLISGKLLQYVRKTDNYIRYLRVDNILKSGNADAALRGWEVKPLSDECDVRGRLKANPIIQIVGDLVSTYHSYSSNNKQFDMSPNEVTTVGFEYVEIKVPDTQFTFCKRIVLAKVKVTTHYSNLSKPTQWDWVHVDLDEKELSVKGTVFSTEKNAIDEARGSIEQYVNNL
ncbi:hypothetical protein [Marinicella sp. W31]|uniref:hypothetical protein n=1 Tax=Marinicella sp. W31 TaxID=3023713 RepID=UPI0037564C49